MIRRLVSVLRTFIACGAAAAVLVATAAFWLPRLLLPTAADRVVEQYIATSCVLALVASVLLWIDTRTRPKDPR